MKKSSEILVKALDYLRDHGVTHDGDFIDCNPGSEVLPANAREAGYPACSIGALNIVEGSPAWNYHTDANASRKYLERAVDTWNIAEWNDSHTDEEVFAAFERAIKLARADND